MKTAIQEADEEKARREEEKANVKVILILRTIPLTARCLDRKPQHELSGWGRCTSESFGWCVILLH